jgi:enhancing lycopene biosynthesis protein 2
LIVCCTFTASKKLSQYALSSGSRKCWICCEKTIVCHNLQDYAKTDGLEYICPHCSITNFKKKPQKVGNGFPPGLMVTRPL